MNLNAGALRPGELVFIFSGFKMQLRSHGRSCLGKRVRQSPLREEVEALNIFLLLHGSR